MSSVGRLVYAVFDTPDVEAAVEYHRDTLGFAPVDGADAEQAQLTAGLDHHVVSLRRGESAALAAIGMELRPDRDLEALVSHLRSNGAEAEIKSDAIAGVPRMIEMRDPEGNVVHLFPEIAGTDKPSPVTGAAPHKLGHICVRVRDVPMMTEWYEVALGFIWSDWLGDFFSFLSCNEDHHSLNLLRGEVSGNVLHHIAYELRDPGHVQVACDVLSDAGFPLVWGPGRHGPGHNIYTYHRNTDGLMVELFTHLDRIVPGSEGVFEPRPWHKDRPQVRKVWPADPLTPNSWGVPPPPDFL
jgi:catechol-2,3-dioxygenase